MCVNLLDQAKMISPFASALLGKSEISGRDERVHRFGKILENFWIWKKTRQIWKNIEHFWIWKKRAKFEKFKFL